MLPLRVLMHFIVLSTLITWLSLAGCAGMPPRIVIDAAHLEYPAPLDSSVTIWENDLIQNLQSVKFELEVPVKPPDLNGWRQVISFVQASDIQIRDYGISYFGKKQAKLIDKVAGGTQRVEKLDRQEEFPFLALVGAINQLQRSSDRPDFLIHTGDAIDTGTQGELARFMTIANALEIPWYSVVGNHDILLMGNFTQANNIIEGEPPLGIGRITNRGNFMSFQGPENKLPAPVATHLISEIPPSMFLPPTRYHGFDCDGEACMNKCNGTKCTLKSYYSIILHTNPIIRLVVLDTTVPDSAIPHLGQTQIPAFGASGTLDEDQFQWLKDQIAASQKNPKREVVFVFGHHPLSSQAGSDELYGIDPDAGQASILDYLKRQPNVLAYFGGHTHSAKIRKYKDLNRGNYAFAEIIAPSLHEFPQLALYISLFTNGRDLRLLIRPVKGKTQSTGPVGVALTSACEGAVEEAEKPVGTLCWQKDANTFAQIDVGQNVEDNRAGSVSVPQISEPNTDNFLTVPHSPSMWFQEAKWYSRSDKDKRLRDITENEDWLTVDRTYRSQSHNGGPFGLNWYFPYSTHIDMQASTVCNPVLWDISGRRIRLESRKQCTRVVQSAKRFVKNATTNTLLHELLNAIPGGTSLPPHALKDFEYIGVDLSGLRSLSVRDSGFRLETANQVFEYSSSGRIERISSKREAPVDVYYDVKGRIIGARDAKHWVSFRYGSGNLIDEVEYDDGRHYSYAYDSNGCLTEVAEAEEQLISYHYDDRHRLVKIANKEPDPLTVIYNDIGWRIGLRRADHERRWDFDDSSASRPQIVTSYLSNGIKISKSQFIFDSEEEVLKMREDEDTVDTEFKLTACGCLPLEVTHGSEETRYQYNDNGSLILKDSPEELIEVSYDSTCKKISRVRRTSKITNVSRQNVFSYDAKANLIRAVDADNNYANLDYDELNRISTLKTGSNNDVETEIQFEYNEFNKPVKIAVKDGGTITVNYRDGIDTPDPQSDSGRKPALAVTSAFQRLLDLIRPANVSIDNSYAKVNADL